MKNKSTDANDVLNQHGTKPPPDALNETIDQPKAKPNGKQHDQEHPEPGPPSSPGRGPNEPVLLQDFRAYMPKHNYIYEPTREMWPARSVNARIPPIPLVDAHGQPMLDGDGNPKKMRAADWLDQHRPVEQLTWFPGLPMLIKDQLIVEGGWVDHPGASVFNQYRPPDIERRVGNVRPWLDHIRYIYPDDADHIIRWCAHCVQHPDIKINHAIVLGGKPGIGKDTLLYPVRYAVGPWNVCAVTPRHMLRTRFNPYLKSVLLFINEGHDLGDADRYAFYDFCKSFMASPPETLLCDEKNIREHRIANLCNTAITTNHLSDGIHLPADDRRHYVAWSERDQIDFHKDYWNDLYKYYDKQGGIAAIATYLADLDLTDFDPKAPPRKTPAFWAIVDASRTSEDAELADVLDRLKNPGAVTLIQVLNKAGEGVTDEEERKGGTFVGWLKDRKNRRKIPHRFECCGYVPVRNEAAKDGLWKIHDRRQVIYGRSALSLRERFDAAATLLHGIGVAAEATTEGLL